MQYELYAIKDELNDFSWPVPFQKHKGEELAVRWFREEGHNNSVMKNNPLDYSLWYVGEFDSESGRIEGATPKLVYRLGMEKTDV